MKQIKRELEFKQDIQTETATNVFEANLQTLNLFTHIILMYKVHI